MGALKYYSVHTGKDAYHINDVNKDEGRDTMAVFGKHLTPIDGSRSADGDHIIHC